MVKQLGKLKECLAVEFVYKNPKAALGSRTKDGYRRVLTHLTEGPELSQLRSAISSYEDFSPPTNTSSIAGSWALGDAVKKALSSVGITEDRVSSWLGAPCNCSERADKLNQVSAWAESILKGIMKPAPFIKDEDPKPVSKLDIVCGCVHEGELEQFFEYARSKHAVGIKTGPLPPDTFHRRIKANAADFPRVKQLIVDWNGGTDVPRYDTPWVPGRWAAALTTVPSRATTLLPETLKAITAAGIQPVLYVDGLLSAEQESAIRQAAGFDVTINQHRNIRTFANWYTAATDLYMTNPWAEHYLFLQDDLTCPKTLLQYLKSCRYPQNGYFNLYTFRENERVIEGKPPGWIEAYRSRQGHQLGLGAVGLIFPHNALITLLTQKHMLTRKRDAVRGNHSLDGAIVEAMNQAGYSEYVHNPSLLQHTGEESSMGNAKHAKALSYRGDDFDLMTLLKDTPNVEQPQPSPGNL
jgi:hypothetical protein